jgi:hypothetical protein
MEITPTPRELNEKWIQRAHFLREYGDTNCARLWELAANELRDAFETHGDETLSLTEGGRESGYSPDHLSRLIKRGVIANAGREGAPRIRRADVPIKDPNGAGRPSKKGRSAGKAQVSERAKSVARAFSRSR